MSRKDIQAALDHCRTIVTAREPRLQALIPEEGRWERLQRDVTRMLSPDLPPTSLPLLGDLVGIKDIIRVDGSPTRCGSTLPSELFSGPEASCVTRLREAGALILGKTVTTEFAYFEPGPTENPRKAGHTPGGSSSGSAAAVAAGYCPLALGSQTVGSVIRPAAYCGVVGFKPSQGRVPLDGVIPYAPSLDQLGWFTPNVEWALRAAAVLIPDWGGIPATPRQPVLGVPISPYLEQATREGIAAFHQQLGMLRSAGWDVRLVPALTYIQQVNQRHQTICCAELAAVHAQWFPTYRERYRPRTAAQILAGQAVAPSELQTALAGRQALREELERAMDAHGIDLWLAPSAPGPAPKGLASTGDPSMNLPWTHAGLPVISLPAGNAPNGLPLGLQVIGRYGTDEQLLTWAALLETTFAAESGSRR